MNDKTPDPARAILGVGWAFPVRPDQSESDVAAAIYEEDIRQAVRLILETEQGERVMRPDFGAGLQSLVFEPLNTTTMALVRNRVEQALITWEPRIDLNEVRVTTDEVTRNRLNIEVTYRIRATNTFYNLVYPFYLQEGLL